MLHPEQRALLDRYIELLLEKNAEVNLTAARDRRSLMQRHVGDALKLLDVPELGAARSVLDLGTGGGLPGLPLAIACPDLEVILLDATSKKVAAVQGFIDTLGLENASAAWGRAEVMAHAPEWRQRFDLVVARAVAPLRTLLELAAPLCRPDGYVAAFKGPGADKELSHATRALETLRCRTVRRVSYCIGDTSFHILVFQVIGKISKRFPRESGAIKARPL